MKKLIFGFALLLSSQLGVAQTYYPLADPCDPDKIFDKLPRHTKKRGNSWGATEYYVFYKHEKDGKYYLFSFELSQLDKKYGEIFDVMILLYLQQLLQKVRATKVKYIYIKKLY